MSLRMLVLSKVIVAGVGIAMLLQGSVARSQEVPEKTREQQDIQQLGSNFAALQRLAYDPKLVEDLELTLDQKKRILVALQKYQDSMRQRLRPKPGETIDRNAYQQQTESVMRETNEILTKKQLAKLSELAKQRAQILRTTLSPEKMQEMQKLSSIMSELMRLSYDAKLADEMEITAEQRVEIREAQQAFQQAMQERMKAGQGEAIDMDKYNEMISKLVMDAQEIMTPEQSKKLSRLVKLKGLKQKFGDEFAMINGLAEDFDLDEKQTQALREKIADVREDFYDKWMDLKNESMQKIIRELPPKHREEAETAVKEFVEEDPRNKLRPFPTSIQIGG